MRAILAIALAATAVSPTSALAAKLRLDLTASADQRTRMDNGIEAVDADLPGSSVRILESEEPVRKRGVLLIYVLNAGGEPVNFGPENVTIESEAGEAFEVIPYDTLVKEEKNRQMWAAIATGLAAASNSYNASTSATSYGSFNAYGSGGWSRGNYSTYNPAAASMATSLANTQNQQSFDRLATNRVASMEALKVNMRTTTVDPGKDFGGQVTFELPKALRSSKVPVPLRIKVRMGAEEHVIAGTLAAWKK